MTYAIPKDHKQTFVFYILTNEVGEHFATDIKPFTALHSNLETNEAVRLTIVDQDVDSRKLFNRAIIYLGQNKMQNLQWALRDQVSKANHGNNRKGTKIICVETGEEFETVKKCADKYRLTYGQLLRHVNGDKGFKSVKGMTYKKL